MSFVTQSDIQSITEKITDFLQIFIGISILIVSCIWLIYLLNIAYKTRALLRKVNQRRGSVNRERTLTNIRTDSYRYLVLILIICSEITGLLFVIFAQVHHSVTYRTYFNTTANNCTVTEGFANQYYSDWVYRLPTALGTVLYSSTFVEVAILNAYLATAYNQCTHFKIVRYLTGWLIIQAIVTFICRIVRVLYHLMSVCIFIILLVNWLLLVKYGKELNRTLKRKSIESELHESDDEIKTTNKKVYTRNKKLFILVSSVLFVFIITQFLDLIVNTFAEGILLNSCTLFGGIHVPINFKFSTKLVNILNKVFDLTKEIREILFTFFTICVLLLYIVIPVSYLIYKLKLRMKIRFYGTHPYRIHAPLIPDYYRQ